MLCLKQNPDTDKRELSITRKFSEFSISERLVGFRLNELFLLAVVGAKKEPRLKHLLFVGVGHDFIYPMSISIKICAWLCSKEEGARGQE